MGEDFSCVFTVSLAQSIDTLDRGLELPNARNCNNSIFVVLQRLAVKYPVPCAACS